MVALGTRFHKISGTSMASPMITGLVALLLHKNPTLTVTQVRTAIRAVPAAGHPDTAPDSTNAYGVGRVDGMPSHANTP